MSKNNRIRKNLKYETLYKDNHKLLMENKVLDSIIQEQKSTIVKLQKRIKGLTNEEE